MHFNNFFILLLAFITASCSNFQSTNDRFPASSERDAVSRVEKSCSLPTRITDKIIQNMDKATYVRGKGQKIQSFILENGRVVLIDLNNCNPHNFRLNGDTVVDSRSASGQLYLRTRNGRIFVMVPNQTNQRFDDAFNIYEVGTLGGSNFTNRYFYSMKRTSKGTQGILAWRSPKCTQDEVAKRNDYRDPVCRDDSAALIIRGKAVDSGRYLKKVQMRSYVERERATIPRIRRPVTQSFQRLPVTVEVLPVRPIQCREVTREIDVTFLFIFSITETETQTICS